LEFNVSLSQYCECDVATYQLASRFDDTVNTVNVMWQHTISWQADSMTIKFARTKNDTQGKRSAKERHLYANPDFPEIFPVKVLAADLAKFPGNRETFRG
jgi:hypothetical protein